MRHIRRFARLLPVFFALVCTSGCALRGAPSFVLFGAYFPAWMLIGSIGILVALGARAALTATGLVELLPQQLLVSLSVGITVAALMWLLWFAR